MRSGSSDDGRWVDRRGPSARPDDTFRSARSRWSSARAAASAHSSTTSLSPTEPELVESVSAAVAFALDNERLQAELRAQNEFLSTIVDTAPSLLLTVDTEARIRTLNPATLSATGLDDESQVRGQFFWDVFLDPDERPAMQERFRAAAPEHAAAEYENTFTNARGERISIIWRGAPVRGESGEVEGIVAAGLDVTERRRAEEEIRASRGRIVAAGDEERRRLERNLHDGAQQRLVSLSLALRLAQSKLELRPAMRSRASSRRRARSSPRRSRSYASSRAASTRRCSPTAASTRRSRGLRRGRRSRSSWLASGGGSPSRSRPRPTTSSRRRSPTSSSTARRSSIQVGIEAENGRLVVEVADDGVGGADAEAGSGLRGLADRVSALDGRLSVDSPPGAGTRVTAELPLPAAVPPE